MAVPKDYSNYNINNSFFLFIVDTIESGCCLYIYNGIDENPTGIGTIHTIDSDGTHRYYDMQGRQLRQRPNRGLYIENGKIQFNK